MVCTSLQLSFKCDLISKDPIPSIDEIKKASCPYGPLTQRLIAVSAVKLLVTSSVV